MTVTPASLSPVELPGQRARLLPLALAHLDALWEAGRAPEVWRFLPDRFQTRDDMERWVRAALAEQERGESLPFTILDQQTGTAVGSTRYADISLPHKGLEIGWTWLTPSVWRTRLNTECKYLLLRYAFESLSMIRVFLKTDARNDRSRRAIERLGALQEGVLRNHRIMPDGYIRDSVVYSIIAEEWPAVKRRLEGFLEDFE